MPEETEKTANSGRVLSLKVTSKTYDEFRQLRTEGQYPTAQLFMQELLERYSDPIVANKNNDEFCFSIFLERKKNSTETWYFGLSISPRSCDLVAVTLISMRL